MSRLDILKSSLLKKEEKFNAMVSAHFADVKQANGQPLNDKRCGHATINRWDRQDKSIANQQKEIEKTKRAIEREESKANGIKHVTEMLPTESVELIKDGILRQWGKYPNIFFVDGVEKARLIYDFKKKQIMHKYTRLIQDKEQYKKFAQIFNSLSKQINK